MAVRMVSVADSSRTQHRSCLQLPKSVLFPVNKTENCKVKTQGMDEVKDASILCPKPPTHTHPSVRIHTATLITSSDALD